MPDLDSLEVRPSRLAWISESAEELSLPIALLVFEKVVVVVLAKKCMLARFVDRGILGEDGTHLVVWWRQGLESK